MRAIPVNDLDECSVRGCQGEVVAIVQKTIGFERVIYGYCQFHSIVSATFFPDQDNRIVVSLGA